MSIEEKTIRPEMVSAAQCFFSSPKVSSTPIEEQKHFLRRKGLYEEEIEAAMKMRGMEGVGDDLCRESMRQSQSKSFLHLTNVIMVLAGFSYAGYKIWRSWLSPIFFGTEDSERERQRRLQAQMVDLQASLNVLLDRLTQTLHLLTERIEKPSDIDRLQKDVAVVKSLLLIRNPVTSILASNTDEPPRWQLQNHVNICFDDEYDTGIESNSKNVQIDELHSNASSIELRNLSEGGMQE